MDFASNRLRLSSPSLPTYEGQLITRITPDIFEVASSKNSSTLYTVNTATTMCSCYEGSTGKLCKHMHYVLSRVEQNPAHYHIKDYRQLMYFVSSGRDAPDGWLNTLHGGAGGQETPATTHISTENAVPVQTLDATEPASDIEEGDDAVSAEEYDKSVSEFHNLFCEKITDRGETNRKELFDALQVAIRTLKLFNNSAISALRTFGKYGAGGNSVVRKLKLSSIPVQTTAYARRKKMIRGSAPGKPGRPRKSAIMKEKYALSKESCSPSPIKCVCQEKYKYW